MNISIDTNLTFKFGDKEFGDKVISLSSEEAEDLYQQLKSSLGKAPDFVMVPRETYPTTDPLPEIFYKGTQCSSSGCCTCTS